MEKKPENRKESPKRSSKTKEIVALQEKETNTTQRERRRDSQLAPYDYVDPWRDTDSTFERFRSDLDLPLWPMRPFPRIPFPRMFSGETKVPYVDLEDRGEDFVLTAELPGFKKENIDLQITRDSVEINAATGWKQDDKTSSYVRKERGSRSVYRMIRLPEEVKTDAAEASLKDGVLEVALPKKILKQKKKLAVR